MATTLPIDETTGRPLWRGLPVPWITRWTGETTDAPLRLARLGGLVYASFIDINRSPFGVTAALRSERDEWGLLWFPEGDAPGVGEPQFKVIHAARQRACMLEGRCQVCGTHFGTQPVTFLDSRTLLKTDSGATADIGFGRPYITVTAPTCRTCAPVAMRLCPAQRAVSRENLVLVTAYRYRPHSVLGDVYGIDEDGKACQEKMFSHIPLDSPLMTRTVVKQLYVEVVKYTEEKI